MTDADIVQAENATADAISRYLRPFLVAGTDPDLHAARIVAELRGRGWWPPLAPPPERPTGNRDPEVARRGAARAREALAAARNRTP